MSNFKIYLQKAQGYDIDTAEIVSVNESFKSYLQKINEELSRGKVEEVNKINSKKTTQELKYDANFKLLESNQYLELIYYPVSQKLNVSLRDNEVKPGLPTEGKFSREFKIPLSNFKDAKINDKTVVSGQNGGTDKDNFKGSLSKEILQNTIKNYIMSALSLDADIEIGSDIFISSSITEAKIENIKRIDTANKISFTVKQINSDKLKTAA